MPGTIHNCFPSAIWLLDLWVWWICVATCILAHSPIFHWIELLTRFTAYSFFFLHWWVTLLELILVQVCWIEIKEFKLKKSNHLHGNQSIVKKLVRGRGVGCRFFENMNKIWFFALIVQKNLKIINFQKKKKNQSPPPLNSPYLCLNPNPKCLRIAP